MTTLYVLFLLIGLVISSYIFIGLLYQFLMLVFRGEIKTEGGEE